MNAQTSISAAPGTTHSTLIGALAAGLAEVEGAIKDAQNLHMKNKYADLASVIAAIKPVARHGLWFRQVTKPDDAGARIETFYIHESGEMSAGEMFVPASKRDPQGFGSALTYCRRYALQTAFGIAPEDDDGEAAMASHKASQGNARQDDARKEPQSQQNGMPDAEWAKLVQLVEATKSDTNAMRKHYGVKALRDLDGKQYMACVEALTKKLAKMAKEETGAKARQATGDILEDEIPY